MTIKSLFEEIKPKNILILTLAGLISAFAVSVFLSPVELYDSGIAGTSMLLARLTPLTISIFLIILNVPLFLYGLKKQGAAFTISSIYTVIIYSLGVWLITEVLPINVDGQSPFAGQDMLLCAVFGGLISGIGSGLSLRGGGALDGVEVFAVIFAKRIGVSVGTFIMAYNVILYIVCGIIVQDWVPPLYSIVAYALASRTIDYIVEGFDRSKSAIIVTEKKNEICSALTEAFETGVTMVDAIGGYSNAKKTMIYFVVNRFQISKLKNVVHSIDPLAYITISDVADVFKTDRN